MFFCTGLPLFLHHVFCSYEFKVRRVTGVPSIEPSLSTVELKVRPSSWSTTDSFETSRNHCLGCWTHAAACSVAELYRMGPGTGPGAAQETSVTAGSLYLLDICKGSFQFLSFVLDPVLISSEHKSKQTGVNN